MVELVRVGLVVRVVRPGRDPAVEGLLVEMAVDALRWADQGG